MMAARSGMDGLTGSIGALGRKAQRLHAEDARDRDAKAGLLV